VDVQIHARRVTTVSKIRAQIASDSQRPHVIGWVKPQRIEHPKNEQTPHKRFHWAAPLAAIQALAFARECGMNEIQIGSVSFAVSGRRMACGRGAFDL